MSEEFPAQKIEQEIIELSRHIEEKRALLEHERGIVEETREKELVRQVVSEKYIETEVKEEVAGTPEQALLQGSPTSNNYLDELDEESSGRVKDLVSQVGEKGIYEAIGNAKKESPLIIDAFHDALVDRLYDMLVERGIIK